VSVNDKVWLSRAWERRRFEIWLAGSVKDSSPLCCFVSTHWTLLMRYNKAPFLWEPLLCQGPTLSWFTSWLVWGKAAPLHHISLGRAAHTPFIALPFWHYRALKISAHFSCKDNNRIDRNNHPVEKSLQWEPLG